MRLSNYYLPVLKEAPAEAAIASHQMMLRAGMIRQGAAGIYSWLPLGLKILRKVENIVREEQNRAGAVEMLMPTIQSADLWKESGRYEAYGKEMLRITDRHDRDMLFGPTNEELITEIFRAGARSYKDLPKMLYHIQWKFRDEVRPRFGVMRGREFLMKDTYSFDLTPEDARKSYYKMFVAYLRSFARMGLRSIPMKADTGPIGGDLSHEFIVLADTGESDVFCHADVVDLPIPPVDTDFSGDLTDIFDQWTSLYAATDEMHDEAAYDAVPEGKKTAAKGIEVGHIFFFGEKYSKPMDLKVQTADQKEALVQMGSYGIGVSRLLGALIEAYHDDRGCKWPVAVAPFEAAVVNLKQGDDATEAACEDLYNQLNAAGIDTLYNDTKARAGEKFATMDLIGVPYQIIIGPRGLKEGLAEVKTRDTGESQDMPLAEAVAFVTDAVKAALVVK